MTDPSLAAVTLPSGQGWKQIGELALAFALSSLIVYEDGQGILRDIPAESTRLGFTIAHVRTQQLEREVRGVAAVAVMLELQGQPTTDPLISSLSEHEGVLEVSSAEVESSID